MSLWQALFWILACLFCFFGLHRQEEKRKHKQSNEYLQNALKLYRRTLELYHKGQTSK